MTTLILILSLLVFPVFGQDYCNGGDSCCDSKPDGCLEGEGDCDTDSHCAGDLVCGKDNCVGEGFDKSDDCCYQPCIPGGLCPTEPVEGIVEYAFYQLSENCHQGKWAVKNFQTQVVAGYLYYFDLELPEAPGCDFEAATKVCHVVVFQPVDSGPSELTIAQTNCTGSTGENGETACEGQGLNQDQCQAVGCCYWEDGQCWSAVGNEPCDSGSGGKKQDCMAMKDAYDLISMAAAAKGCDFTRTGDPVISLQTCFAISCTADLLRKSSSCKRPSDSAGDCKALENMAKGLLNVWYSTCWLTK